MKANVNKDVASSTTGPNKNISDNIDEEGRNRNNTPKLKNSILQFYQDRVGRPVTNAMFNNIGESFGGLAGGIYGYTSEEDPEATMMQKLGKGLLYSLMGAGVVKSGKYIDGKFNNSALTEMVSRGVIADYGLIPEYLTIRTNFRLNKNRIAAEFYDIQKKVGTELSQEQNKFLWAMMSGEVKLFDSIDPKLLNLNDEARTLITKYAQELMDAGLISKKTIEKNKATYLKRSY